MHGRLRELPFSAVRWTGGFWKAKEDACVRRTIAAVEAGLHDPGNGSPFRNFRILAGLEKGEYAGSAYWGDGDCYKWIEAAVYAVDIGSDRDLEARVERHIDLIGRAQAPDGYLHTYVQMKGEVRWATRHFHEDYNFGHLFTAAAVHKTITGRDAFLGIALKAAHCLRRAYADDPAGFAHFGWNPSHLMGLVDLYRVAGERWLLDLAAAFVELKGSGPPVFDYAPGVATPRTGGDQNQDRVPLRRETGPVGHAVTGMYLYAGAADVCRERDDAVLLGALERIWTTLRDRQLYVTGAVGPMHVGLSVRGDLVHEGFDRDFRLPSYTAYNETCANIGNAMWNQRMLYLTAEGKYADMVELVMYNSGLSGQSVEGDRFRYTNPLGWQGVDHPLLMHDSHERWRTFDCYCCPPQIARTIAGISRWAYSIGDDGLRLNLYGSSRVDVGTSAGRLVFSQQTDYPWAGEVTVRIETAPAARYSLFFRIPGWCREFGIFVNGVATTGPARPGRYAQISRHWEPGDIVRMTLGMEVRLVTASRKVEELNNKAALMRGPVVYCVEDADLPEGTSALEVHVPRGAVFAAEYRPGLLGGVAVLTGRGVAVSAEAGGEGSLYRGIGAVRSEELDLTLVPYFAWNNRGPGAMAVWLPLF